MKTLLKLANLIAWISFALGVFLMACAAISSLPKYTMIGQPEMQPEYLFGVEHRINFFQAATPLFIITIILFLFIYMNRQAKD